MFGTDGQVRLIHLQTITFRYFVHQQTDKDKLPFAQWANGKRILKKHMGFCFLFETVACIYMLPFQYIYTENWTMRKWQLPFVCCKPKTEMADFHLFPANGSGKRKLIFLSRQMISDNRRLLFQQTCPSMMFSLAASFYWHKLEERMLQGPLRKEIDESPMLIV